MSKDKLDGMEKAAVGIAVSLILIVLAALGLLGWGFIEVVQWLTSK